MSLFMVFNYNLLLVMVWKTTNKEGSIEEHLLENKNGDVEMKGYRSIIEPTFNQKSTQSQISYTDKDFCIFIQN